MDSERYHLLGAVRMARQVVHRMNNLIGGVMGYSEILIRQAEKEHKEHPFASQIYKVGIEASDMLSAFYSYLHLWDHMGVSSFAVSDMLHDAVQLMRSTYPMIVFDSQRDADSDFPEQQPVCAIRPILVESMITVLNEIAFLSNATTPIAIRYSLQKGLPQLFSDGPADTNANAIFLLMTIVPPEGFSPVSSRMTFSPAMAAPSELESATSRFAPIKEFIVGNGGRFHFTDHPPYYGVVCFPVSLP